MNEPAGFCDGECTKSDLEPEPGKENLNDPPYVPGNVPLYTHTIFLDAMTQMGPQYDTHNLYGYLETKGMK
jgi:alpha-glucosidase (family GH31 glycosyl hydrolase)